MRTGSLTRPRAANVEDVASGHHGAAYPVREDDRWRKPRIAIGGGTWAVTPKPAMGSLRRETLPLCPRRDRLLERAIGAGNRGVRAAGADV